MSRAEREARNADIRDWAAVNWHEALAPRGRIPDAVVEAYYAARGIPTGPPAPDEDETPDVSRETSGDGGDGTADVSRETSADEVTPDPAPSRPRGRRRRPAAKSRRKSATPVVVTDAVRRDIRARLALLAMPVLMIAELRDPVCGGALANQRDDLLDWATDYVCDSAELVAWFVTAGTYERWLQLAGILAPVASVAVRHHVTHTLPDDEGGSGDDFDPAYAAVPPDLYVAASSV